MEKITLNDTLELTFPDGFRKLTEAEMKQQAITQSGPGVCLKDEDRHIVVSLGWRRTGLLDALLNGKDLTKSAQGRIANVMRPYGYQLTGYLNRQAGGESISGFGYTYTAQNIAMEGECCAVKKDKTVYYLHFYARKAFRDEAFRLWEEILKNARWER